MDGIKIDVTGNIAKVTEKPRRITSGTIGLPVEFTFDDQWDGLSKKAVFRTGHFSIVCDLNEEKNTVPWEVLVFPNMWLSIGVYGVNEGGTVSIPTIWVNVSVIQHGTVPDGASPAEPTPPVWQRIEDKVNRIGNVVDGVNKEYADTKEQINKLDDKIDVESDETNKKVANAVSESNSYTDKSIKETIDKLCPIFSESGGSVRCEPVEGYPLRVVTELETEVDSLTLTICGKNLFNKNKYTLTTGYANYTTGVIASSSNYLRPSEFVPVSHLQGKNIILNRSVGGSNPGMAFYSRIPESTASPGNAFISGNKSGAVRVPDNAEYMSFSIPNDGDTDVQIEIGEVSTAYEEYREVIHTAELQEPLSNGQYEWSGIEAMAGVNTIWSSYGTTSVTGKSDPVAIINKLTQAVLSLGGNI